MTKIYFVRHAQPVANADWPDDRTRPLTAQGMADRQVVMDVMGDIPMNAAYCSPFARSMETIAAFVQMRGLEIVTDERLRERAAGAENWEHLERRWADFLYFEEGGESLQSAQTRNVEVLREILDRHDGQTVLIGTHGAALSTILHHCDAAYGCADYRRILNSLPYIIRLDFEDRRYIGQEELHWNDCGYATRKGRVE